MRPVAPALCFVGVLLLLTGLPGPSAAPVADAVVSGAGHGTVRRASSPPAVPVGDLAFDNGVEQQLDWTYYRNGDYDQNGEVNISDVTVVGQKFGKTSAHLDWPTARVADGDGNGEVNISDLTPIGVNFGSRVTHFMVHWADAEPGPFEPSEPWNPDSYITTQFGSVPIPPGGGPRLFTHYLTYPIAGKYYSIVAFDGSAAAAVHSNVVHFNPNNQPPLAGMAVDSAGLPQPKGSTIYIAAGFSSDADGTILNFEWDPLGTGQFLSTGLTSELYFPYNDVGEYTPVLRVTDDGGATSTTTYRTPQVLIVE